MTGGLDIVRPNAAEAIEARGVSILARLGIDATAPAELAAVLAASAGELFSDRVERGLVTLLRAVARRDPALASAAATTLIGVGPGRTPLGDDYLASCALTVARLGEHAGFHRPTRAEWLAALLPRGPATITTRVSTRLIVDALRGCGPVPATALLRLRSGDPRLGGSIDALCAIGASSGRAWAAGIGATATLLAGNHHDPTRGDAAL